MDAAQSPLPPGLSLRATPGFREKVLGSVGIRPAVLGRWLVCVPTAHSAGSAKGTFWKLERRD